MLLFELRAKWQNYRNQMVWNIWNKRWHISCDSVGLISHADRDRAHIFVLVQRTFFIMNAMALALYI